MATTRARRAAATQTAPAASATRAPSTAASRPKTRCSSCSATSSSFRRADVRLRAAALSALLALLGLACDEPGADTRADADAAVLPDDAAVAGDAEPDAEPVEPEPV